MDRWIGAESGRHGRRFSARRDQVGQQGRCVGRWGGWMLMFLFSLINVVARFCLFAGGFVGRRVDGWVGGWVS